MNSIADIRKDYRMRTLSENDVKKNPVEQFTVWWDEAIASEIDEVNAMTLATVNEQGRPSARIVLLKGMDENGFEFFTNYESRKGNDIQANEHAALVFFWKELERQVRIEGTVAKVPASVSDEYFLSRPVKSRIGAWSSPQSKVIPSREVLDENVKTVEQKFEGREVIRPSFWGGYIVKPEMIEFWQGRPSRLHDRIAYYQENGEWVIRRLAP